MTPAHPPLPTAWNFPFQPDAGIQTSILMSESLDGFSVAATRQKGGRPAKGPRPGAGPRPRASGAVERPGPAGGVNCPAATSCAIVIEVPGTASAARLSHVAAADTAVWAGVRASAPAVARTSAITNRIVPPLLIPESACVDVRKRSTAPFWLNAIIKKGRAPFFGMCRAKRLPGLGCTNLHFHRADVLDVRGDHVARLNGAHAFGRSRDENIARIQRIERGGVLDQLRDPE